MAEIVGRGRLDAVSVMLSLETLWVVELGWVRSDLTPVEVQLSKVEALEVGFMGTVVFRKLPKVKEKPAAASICMAT